MPSAEPWTETKTVQLIDTENDPAEEIFPLSHIDQMYVKMYFPITTTYEIPAGLDKDVVITNLIKGFQKTASEYRFLAGYIHADAKGKVFVKRSAAHPSFTFHINHLEHTSFPSYHELEQREFPFSHLHAQHFPPNLDLNADASTQPGTGYPTTIIQLNLIRNGLVLGTAIHHQCVGAKGADVVLARWAANTRALFTNTTPPPFDPACLDPSPLISTTSLPAHQLAETQARIKTLEYVPPAPPAPQPAAPPLDIAHATFHFSPSQIAALKAAATPPGGTSWVSTYDAVTALVWRAMARARLPSHGIALDDPVRTVRLLQPIDVRPYTSPPLAAQAYPGNSVVLGAVDVPVATLLGPTGLSTVASAIRASVHDGRKPATIKQFLNYIASFPHSGGVRMTFDVTQGTQTTVTGWGIMNAYETHDFGFGGLKALRLGTGVYVGTFVVYPRMGWKGESEGVEVFLTLERGEMERLREDGEVAGWGEEREA